MCNKIILTKSCVYSIYSNLYEIYGKWVAKPQWNYFYINLIFIQPAPLNQQQYLSAFLNNADPRISLKVQIVNN